MTDTHAIRAALAKMTPGEWGHSDKEIGAVCGWLEPDEYRPIVHCSGSVDDWFENSAGIILLRNNAEALLDRIDEQDARIAALEGVLLHVTDWLGRRN